MQQGTHEIEVPGARLRVEITGSGEVPMVLIHGLANDSSLWDDLWPALSAGRRALRYDMRGFGRSAALEPAHFRHSRDLKNLLDALGIERCDIVAVSMGGSVALNFTLDHPSMVRRQALLSPGIVAWEWSDEWRERWRRIVEVARAGDIPGARELWWNHPLFDTTRAIPAAAAKLRETLTAYSGAVWAEDDLEEHMLPDLDRLPFLEVPTLLLTGASDLADFRLIADLIEAAAPDVRRIDYEGAGHMLNLEIPEAVAKEVLAFLA